MAVRPANTKLSPPAVVHADGYVVRGSIHPVARELFVRPHANFGHERLERAVLDWFGCERIGRHCTIGQRDRNDIWDTVIRGFTHLGIPLLLVVAIAAAVDMPGQMISDNVDASDISGAQAFCMQFGEYDSGDLYLKVTRELLETDTLCGVGAVLWLAYRIRTEWPAAHLFAESFVSCEWTPGPSHSLGRQPGGKYGPHHRVRRRAAFPIRQLTR